MKKIIQEALSEGAEMHVAGQFDLASQLYDSVIKLDPNHADANHNMGLLKVDMGQDLGALPYLQTALQADPGVAQFWLSYIKALIKLDREEEAVRILSLAKESGLEGEEFLELHQKLIEPTHEKEHANQEADTSNQFRSNILDTLKLDKALRLAKSNIKEGSPEEAKHIYQDILDKFPKNKKAQKGLATLNKPRQSIGRQGPPQEIINQLVNLYNQGMLTAVVEQSKNLTQKYPNEFIIWNIMGAANQGLGRVDEAAVAFKKVTGLNTNFPDGYNNLGATLQEQGKLEEAIVAFKKALSLKPNYAEAFNNMGLVLQQQGKLETAIKAYREAISLQPNYAEVYNNLGVLLQRQGKLEEAIDNYNEALKIKPNYAEAFNNLGNANQKQGKLDEAIEAYGVALSITPDYVEAYYNKGNALKGQGKLNEAVEFFRKTLSLKPNYASAHRNLSSLIKYQSKDPQIGIVKELLAGSGITDNDRCQLHYTYAKMSEDLGNVDDAFENYVAGGSLRKKLISYELDLDKRRFAEIKANAPMLKKLSFTKTFKAAPCQPIFILGMPRSGTTLVEQIIACHSKVNAAGELSLLNDYDHLIRSGVMAINSSKLIDLRNTYLTKIKKLSKYKPFVTDKTPQNFLYIGLILKVLPEAKIVHVTRNPAATCWSCFKHYFPGKDLSYSYNLNDAVGYYKMYQELIRFWDRHYGGQIYHLNYERLTIEQEIETRKLIEHLELGWEDACLSPEENRRSIRTASQLQVTKKVYKGSSDAWRKYEKFLKGTFEALEK